MSVTTPGRGGGGPPAFSLNLLDNVTDQLHQHAVCGPGIDFRRRYIILPEKRTHLDVTSHIVNVLLVTRA